MLPQHTDYLLRTEMTFIDQPARHRVGLPEGRLTLISAIGSADLNPAGIELIPGGIAHVRFPPALVNRFIFLDAKSRDDGVRIYASCRHRSAVR